MKIVNQYDEKDIEILSKKMPENPCSKCYDSSFCTGCSLSRDYQKEISRYYERNIYDTALIIGLLRKIKKKQQELEKEYKEQYQKLEDLMGEAVCKITI